MKPTAKVAIITRTRNRPLLLARAMDSVLGQTERDWIHVLVNDGGDRQEVDALASEREAAYGGRLSVIHRSDSNGMEAASNAGISASESRFLAIHDDDDTWRPEFLRETLAYFEQPARPESVRGVVTGFEQVRERIERDRIVETGREDVSDWAESLSLWKVAGMNRFPPIAFLYERSVLEEIGPYDEALPVQGDWEFNLRFLARYDIGRVHRVLAGYHHRVASEDAYANTVTEAARRHGFHADLVRNRLLRQDLEAGKFGLGVLTNMAAGQAEAQDTLKSNHTMLKSFYDVKHGVARKLRRLRLLK